MLNLSRIYAKYAKLMAEYFLKQIQEGYDFDRKKKYSVLSKSTLAGQPKRKPDTRLRKAYGYTTGQFSTRGLKGVALPNGFMIVPRDARSYSIFNYNDSEGDSAHIKDPPTMLPTTQIEVEGLPIWKNYMNEVAAEVVNQANIQLGPNKTIEIRI